MQRVMRHLLFVLMPILIASVWLSYSIAQDAASESSHAAAKGAATSDAEADEQLPKSEAEWRKRLSAAEYRVLRKKGTERPFSGKYLKNHAPGTYHCAGCGQKLFSSDTKFESGTGWPSFYQPIDKQNVKFTNDDSGPYRRVEVLCRRCGGHLGHVFDDGPAPTGMRFCINSVCLKFEPAEKKN